jgi:hypothetical protein
MRDDNARAANHQAVQRLLHQLLIFRVEGARGLVEEEDFWV